MATAPPPPPPPQKPVPFFAKLAEMPTTSFRIVVGIVLAVIYVLVLLVAIVFDKFNANTPMAPLYIVGSFILIQMGLDVAQFTAQRTTYTPGTPVGTKDIEDQAGGKTTSH